MWLEPYQLRHIVFLGEAWNEFRLMLQHTAGKVVCHPDIEHPLLTCHNVCPEGVGPCHSRSSSRSLLWFAAYYCVESTPESIRLQPEPTTRHSERSLRSEESLLDGSRARLRQQEPGKPRSIPKLSARRHFGALEMLRSKRKVRAIFPRGMFADHCDVSPCMVNK